MPAAFQSSMSAAKPLSLTVTQFPRLKLTQALSAARTISVTRAGRRKVKGHLRNGKRWKVLGRSEAQSRIVPRSTVTTRRLYGYTSSCLTSRRFSNGVDSWRCLGSATTTDRKGTAKAEQRRRRRKSCQLRGGSSVSTPFARRDKREGVMECRW